MGNDDPPAPADRGPPFFRSWNSMYLLVLGALAAQVAIYWAITRMFE